MGAAERAGHACERCGVATWAQFCRDCRSTDPFMAAGGKSARERAAEARARREAWEGFIGELRRVAGTH